MKILKLKYQSRNYFKNINEFVIIKQIGIGSFGKVNLSLHIQTNKFYALKIVQINQQFTQKQIMLLERQIYIHLNIDHPHIIKLWDVFEDQKNIFLVMQLAQNSTLFSYQNKMKIFSQTQAFKFFNQTLKAIEYMHSLNIMHRDIKPQNILLDNNNNVKLCDLGWAAENIHMKRNTFCGTYQYMAPQMIFQKDYNYKIDIWALGVLLYQLIHGGAPFQARSFNEIKAKVSQGSYQISDQCSDQLKKLITDLLQFNPQKRPQISQINDYQWIQKMKYQIQKDVFKFKNNIETSSTDSSKVKSSVHRKQIIYQSLNKNHRKNDSNLHTSYQKSTQIQQNKNEMFKDKQKIKNNANQTQQGPNIKKLKKKCKTQGEQSLQKYQMQIFKTNKVSKLLGSSINFRKKNQKQKQNSNLLFTSNHFAKTSNLVQNISSIQTGISKNQIKSMTRNKKLPDSSKRQKIKENQKKVSSRLRTINFF